MKQVNNKLQFLFIILLLNSCKNIDNNNNNFVNQNYLNIDSLYFDYLNIKDDYAFLCKESQIGNNYLSNNYNYNWSLQFGYYILKNYGLIGLNSCGIYGNNLIQINNESKFGKNFYVKLTDNWKSINKNIMDSMYHDNYYLVVDFEPEIEGLQIREYLKKKIKIRNNSKIIFTAFIDFNKKGVVTASIERKTASIYDSLFIKTINGIINYTPAFKNKKAVNYRYYYVFKN